MGFFSNLFSNNKTEDTTTTNDSITLYPTFMRLYTDYRSESCIAEFIGLRNVWTTETVCKYLSGEAVLPSLHVDKLYHDADGRFYAWCSIQENEYVPLESEKKKIKVLPCWEIIGEDNRRTVVTEVTEFYELIYVG